jgi:hypothetical protein
LNNIESRKVKKNDFKSTFVAPMGLSFKSLETVKQKEPESYLSSEAITTLVVFTYHFTVRNQFVWGDKFKIDLTSLPFSRLNSKMTCYYIQK